MLALQSAASLLPNQLPQQSRLCPDPLIQLIPGSISERQNTSWQMASTNFGIGLMTVGRMYHT